jgi:hypothetical protein
MSTPATLTPEQADPVLGPMLQSFLACVCAELAASGRPPCACCLVWGDTPPPADFCNCECEGDGSGQAWVRVVRMDPAAVGNRLTTMKCQPIRLRAWIEAGVYRCVPTGDEHGPPTCDERTDSALGLIRDARSLLTAVACCPALRPHRMEFMSADPMSALGGCSGTNIQFTLDL